MMRSQYCSSNSWMGAWSGVSAALFTATSRRPYFSTAAATMALTCSPFEMSTLTNAASPPLATMSSTTDWPFSSLKSATTTFAPAWAKRRAVASPMPCAAPVTMATLSWRTGNVMTCSFHLRGELEPEWPH